MLRFGLAALLFWVSFSFKDSAWANSGPDKAPPDPYETLYAIPFDPGSYALSENAVRIIERNARALALHPCVKFNLIGSAGSVEEPNKDKATLLGKKRADAVLKQHLSVSTPANKIEAVSWGSQTEMGPSEFQQSYQRRVVYEVSTWTDACPRAEMADNTDARFFKLLNSSGIKISNLVQTVNEPVDKWTWSIKGKVYEPAYTNVNVPTMLGWMELNNSFGYSDDKYALEFYYYPNDQHKKCDLSDVLSISARVRLTEPTETREEVFLFVNLMRSTTGEFEQDHLQFTKPDDKTIVGTIYGDMPWVYVQIPAGQKPCPKTAIKDPPYYQTGESKGICLHSLLFTRPHKIHFELKCP